MDNPKHSWVLREALKIMRYFLKINSGFFFDFLSALGFSRWLWFIFSNFSLEPQRVQFGGGGKKKMRGKLTCSCIHMTHASWVYRKMLNLAKLLTNLQELATLMLVLGTSLDGEYYPLVIQLSKQRKRRGITRRKRKERVVLNVQQQQQNLNQLNTWHGKHLIWEVGNLLNIGVFLFQALANTVTALFGNKTKK